MGLAVDISGAALKYLHQRQRNGFERIEKLDFNFSGKIEIIYLQRVVGPEQ